MTHSSFFNEAQTTTRELFTQQRQTSEAKAAAEVDARNRRIAQVAELVARNLTHPDSHGFTSISDDTFNSFYQAVVDILGPDVKIYRVIEMRDGGPRTRNHYACQCEFGQIERHLKQHLRAYSIEHMQTFTATPPAAPS